MGCCCGGGGASHEHEHCAHSHMSAEPSQDWQGGSCVLLCCTPTALVIVHGMDARSSPVNTCSSAKHQHGGSQHAR